MRKQRTIVFELFGTENYGRVSRGYVQNLIIHYKAKLNKARNILKYKRIYLDWSEIDPYEIRAMDLELMVSKLEKVFDESKGQINHKSGFSLDLITNQWNYNFRSQDKFHVK